MDEFLDYHSNKPWSYGGRYRFYESGKAKKNDIDKILNRSDIYTRFRRHRRPKKYSPVFVYKRRELFQSDVVFFTNKDLVDANNGFKYLFTTIDVFSKKAWVYPLKQNTCKNIMNCFQDILSKCGEQPERLNTDRGSEMICKSFRDYLKQKQIHHYLSYSLRKCPVIERFNLTIQNLLYRIMAQNRSYKWTKFLDNAMEIYLNRKHRTIKMSPIEGDKKKNESIVREHFLKKYFKAGLKKSSPKYKIGDTVRIWKEKNTFDRGYAEQFSREYFTIDIVKTNLPVPRYVLKDSVGENITGSFFEDEIILYTPSEFFDVEVKKERWRGKKKEYLIHYVGYPSHTDRWVGSDQLKVL